MRDGYEHERIGFGGFSRLLSSTLRLSHVVFHSPRNLRKWQNLFRHEGWQPRFGSGEKNQASTMNDLREIELL